MIRQKAGASRHCLAARSEQAFDATNFCNRECKTAAPVHYTLAALEDDIETIDVEA